MSEICIRAHPLIFFRGQPNRGLPTRWSYTVRMHGCLPHLPGVPVIETERLRLRGHTMDDFADTAALWGDAAVVQFMSGKPFTQEECWTRFLRYIGHWAVLGFGYWVVEEKTTGSFAGEVGFGNFKRDLEPPLGAVPELGWVLARPFHGRGYATEAAGAALAWGREHFDTPGFACLIHPDHRASIRVAIKCGFTEERRGQYKGRPTVVFKLA
jgi:RimJ/RimL family protein N-acetyltransferase